MIQRLVEMLEDACHYQNKLEFPSSAHIVYAEPATSTPPK